jgi:hypothetical protein
MVLVGYKSIASRENFYVNKLKLEMLEKQFLALELNLIDNFITFGVHVMKLNLVIITCLFYLAGCAGSSNANFSVLGPNKFEASYSTASYAGCNDSPSPNRLSLNISNGYCAAEGNGFAATSVVTRKTIVGCAITFSCFDKVSEDKRINEENIRNKALAEEQARLKSEKDRIASEIAAKRYDEERKIREIEDQRAKREAERILIAKKDTLRNAGILETTVENLILNFEFYKGKRIFTRCVISAYGKNGGACRSLQNTNHSIDFEREGINKELDSWLLTNCSNSYFETTGGRYPRYLNLQDCFRMGIVGVVYGSGSSPKLKNASRYDY